MQLFQIGSTGEDVRRIQEMLNLLLPTSPPLRADGIFGQKTEERLKQFQSSARLKPDGIAGPMTSKALVATVLGATLR